MKEYSKYLACEKCGNDETLPDGLFIKRAFFVVPSDLRDGEFIPAGVESPTHEVIGCTCPCGWKWEMEPR